MGKIILNGTDYSGSGGSGGHTIVDPTGTDMPQENKLQFTGNVSVSDDAVNGQTVVDILGGGGNVYGAFIDPTRVVYSSFVFDSSAHTWTATEDCILTDNMLPPDSTTAYFIRIGGKQVFAGYSTVEDPFVYVKKGQVVEYRAKSGSSLKAYGVTQGTNGIFAPVIYSDTERVIGVWRDNKPLYQKTVPFSFTCGSNDYTYNIETLTADIEVKEIIDGGIWRDGTFFNNGIFPPNDIYYLFRATPQNILDIRVGNSDSNLIVGNVTYRYTKTTDVAGSGNWNTDGVPTHHYSTNEQVIGTWIDGKPLYQKTIDVGALPNSTTKTVNYDVVNVDAIVKLFGIGIAPTGACCPIPFSDDYSSAGNILLDANTSNGTIRLISQSDKSPFHGYITIQYTKTTD